MSTICPQWQSFKAPRLHADVNIVILVYNKVAQTTGKARKMNRTLQSQHRERQYKIARHPSGKGWVVTRPDTGSTVKVSQKLLDRTSARLTAGEAIEWRTISYTVAIEQGALAVLRGQGLDIVADDVTRTYNLA